MLSADAWLSSWNIHDIQGTKLTKSYFTANVLLYSTMLTDFSPTIEATDFQIDKDELRTASPTLNS